MYCGYPHIHRNAIAIFGIETLLAIRMADCEPITGNPFSDYLEWANRPGRNRYLRTHW
ncbi:hypothetical protein BH10PLA2_BH10PLA2_23720 [soil metagenome]